MIKTKIQNIIKKNTKSYDLVAIYSIIKSFILIVLLFENSELDYYLHYRMQDIFYFPDKMQSLKV